MRRLLLACSLAVCTLLVPLRADPPPGYYADAVGLSGEALKTALHGIIDGHTVIPYDDLFPALYVVWEDPANPSNVRPIYGGAPVPKTSFSWNREHLWPRSRGVEDTGPDTSDLFHVVPCDDDVNTQRSNLYFDYSSALDGGIISPAHAEAPLATRDSNSWEPPPNERGDIARAMFYMAVRYDGTEALTTDLEVVNGTPSGPQMARLDTFLRWHMADPPDAAERARNDRIYSDYQHNRNPFIDHPEWVEAIWGMPPSQIVAQAIASDSKATELPLSTGVITIQLNIPAGPAGTAISFGATGTAQRAEYTLTGNGVSYDPGTGAGTVLVAAGATIAMIVVSPISDGLSESPETAVLSLSASAGYTVGGGPATVTITDAPPTPPTGSIATWSFDASVFPFQVPSDTGLALLDSSGWTGEIQSFSGVGTNSQSYVLEGDLGNGSHIDFKCSTLGFGSLGLTFQTRGSATGFSVGTWSWSIDGTTFTTLPGINTATQNTAFTARTVDFSSLAALNHQPNVTFRYTLSGATSEMGNNRIDNFAINAVPLPGITISANSNSVQEGAASPIVLTLTSSLPAPAGGLSINLLFAGSATAGVDFSLGGVSAFDSTSGIATINIPAGATTVACQITALNDANPIEFAESINAQLVMNATRRYMAVSPSNAIVTLNDRTPYNPAWIARFPTLQPAQAAPLDDPDHDGRTNLEEYSADANPLVSDLNSRPTISVMMLPDPGSGGALRQFVTFSFLRRIDANSPAYTPQSSANFSNWNNNLVFVESVPGPTGATEHATFRAAAPLSGIGIPSQLFFRLKIDSAP
jgi:endonuclease I